MQHTRRKFIKQQGLSLSDAFLSPYLFTCQNDLSARGSIHNDGSLLSSNGNIIHEDPISIINTVAKIGYWHVETFGLDTAAGTYWQLPITELKRVLEDNNLKTHIGHYD